MHQMRASLKSEAPQARATQCGECAGTTDSDDALASGAAALLSQRELVRGNAGLRASVPWPCNRSVQHWS